MTSLSQISLSTQTFREDEKCSPESKNNSGGVLNELALFGGIGGGLLASKILGWQTICAVELNPYRRSALMARQDDGSLEPFPVWDDIRTFDALPWRGRIDVVSGGFPCQAHSHATRGRNTADDLWPEMRRIVAEAAPRYVFAENVTRKAIDAAADDLDAMGYQTRCIALSTKDVGGDDDRKRYWLRAHADDEGELCSAVDAEMALLRELCTRVWNSEPGGSRVPNGLPNRMERLEATGDGQVPIVAAAAWRLLSSSLTSSEPTTDR